MICFVHVLQRKYLANITELCIYYTPFDLQLVLKQMYDKQSIKILGAGYTDTISRLAFNLDGSLVTIAPMNTCMSPWDTRNM